MSIHRIDQANFAQISNGALRDKRLSFRARGVLAMVLSHAEDWEASRRWIVTQSDKEGKSAVQAALNELTELGYREVTTERDASGLLSTVVHWHHVPIPGDRLNRPPDNPATGQPGEHIEHYLSEHYLSENHQQNTSDVSDETRTRASNAATLLADKITENGSKPPTVTDAWLKELDRMNRIDGRTWDEIDGAIRWSQSDPFWKANIRSPSKLRKHYDQMRLQAERRHVRPKGAEAAEQLLAEMNATKEINK